MITILLKRLKLFMANLNKHPALFWDDPEPVDPYQSLKVRFVEEYMVDYDAHAAVIRINDGILAPHTIQAYVQNFMGDSFVRNLIKQKEEEFAKRLEQKDPILLGRIGASLYKESQIASSGASRVAALKILLDVFNINNVTTINDNNFLNVVELNKEQIVDKCKELGLPTSIYENDFVEG